MRRVLGGCDAARSARRGSLTGKVGPVHIWECFGCDLMVDVAEVIVPARVPIAKMLDRDL